MAMETDSIPDFLSSLREDAPEEYLNFFLEFEDYWERKLWHELTNKLVDYFEEDESSDQRIPLFNTFIKSFADKINQLKLVQLGLSAAEEYKDDKERLQFLQSLAESVNKPASQDAYVYATVAVADVLLRLGEYDDARKKLDDCEKILDTFDSVETVVHAAFYKTNASYYQAKLDFTAYYRNALLYLACIDLSSLSKGEQQTRAYDLAIAALVSDTIYNFGELLLHPILDSLHKSPHAWLRDLLFAFNAGEMRAFDILSANSGKNKMLKEHQQFLYQKISLSALTEAVFRRPPHDRSLAFDTISQETKVGHDDAEHLVMKALSLGLLKGTVDQVDEIAKIHWVQPKVLDMKQIAGMRERLKEWDASVNQLGNWIEGVGKDVWAA